MGRERAEGCSPGGWLRRGGGTEQGECMCEGQGRKGKVFGGGRGAEAESLRATVWVCILKAKFILGRLFI